MSWKFWVDKLFQKLKKFIISGYTLWSKYVSEPNKKIKSAKYAMIFAVSKNLGFKDPFCKTFFNWNISEIVEIYNSFFAFIFWTIEI